MFEHVDPEQVQKTAQMILELCPSCRLTLLAEVAYLSPEAVSLAMEAGRGRILQEVAEAADAAQD